MLFKETVEKGTLSILETLQQDEKLSNFYLVGGTALALMLGHRISIDLDLFSPTTFDTVGLTYFSDIDFTAKIDLIDATYRFEPINERLHDMKRYPDKVFPDFPIKKNHPQKV